MSLKSTALRLQETIPVANNVYIPWLVQTSVPNILGLFRVFPRLINPRVHFEPERIDQPLR
jgi:hypothetical protein